MNCQNGDDKMKCYMCGKGTLARKEVVHKLYGVPIGNYPAEICEKCGEIFYDEETSNKIEADTKAKGLYGLSAKAICILTTSQ